MDTKRTLFLISLIAAFCLLLSANNYQRTQAAEIGNAIPKEDRETLKLFFQEIVYNEHFGFTLFGNKPISLTGYFDPIPFENYLQTHLNNILKNGWETWKKYCSIIPESNYLWLEETENDLKVITIINKIALLKTLEEHRILFLSVLGDAFSPQEFLQKLEEPNASLFQLIHEHEGLYGICLGYGKTNAYLYHRRAELNIYTSQAVFSLSKSTPSSGFSSLDDEIHFLRDELTGVEHNSMLSPVRLPQFVGIRNHPETKRLRKNYKNIRAQMMVRLAKEDILDLALQQLCTPVKVSPHGGKFSNGPASTTRQPQGKARR